MMLSRFVRTRAAQSCGCIMNREKIAEFGVDETDSLLPVFSHQTNAKIVRRDEYGRQGR